MSPYVTAGTLGKTLWVPFGAAETALDPGSCQPLCVLELQPGQLAKLAWLTLNYIRYTEAFVPAKINPAFACVYLALYGSEGFVVQVIPGQPLAYVGLDIPGVSQISPWLAPQISEPDTYTILMVNNMTDAQAMVSAVGSWRLALGS